MAELELDVLKSADEDAPYEKYIEVEGRNSTYEVPVSGLDISSMEKAGVRDNHERVNIQRVVVETSPGKLPEIVGLAWDPTDWMTVIVMNRDSETESGWKLVENASRTTSANSEVLWERIGWVEEFIEECEKNGIDETPIVDWFMMTVSERSRSEWAEIRDVSRQALSDNFLKATE